MVVCVQNTNEWHYNDHFKPFAAAFGLDAASDNSVSENFMSILYAGPPEHGPETTEAVRRINKEAINFLLEDHVGDVARPVVSTDMKVEGENIVADVRVINGIPNAYRFACYCLKDGTIIEKKFYQNDSRFVFGTTGPGKYVCQGYAMNQEGAKLIEFSNTVELPMPPGRQSQQALS